MEVLDREEFLDLRPVGSSSAIFHGSAGTFGTYSKVSWRRVGIVSTWSNNDEAVILEPLRIQRHVKACQAQPIFLWSGAKC